MTQAEKEETPIQSYTVADDITIHDYTIKTDHSGKAVTSGNCTATPLPYNPSFIKNPWKPDQYLIVYRYDNIPRAWKFFRYETQSCIGIRELDSSFKSVSEHAYDINNRYSSRPFGLLVEQAKVAPGLATATIYP